MKSLFIFFLFIGHVHATSLGQYHSSPEGSSLQKFEISSDKVTYEKRSNFFDEKVDLTLGEFSTSYKLPKKDQEVIKSTLLKIKDVDNFMKKKNSSFNDLSKKTPHQSFIVLDGYRIAKESDLYPPMKALYDQLASQSWKHELGIRLSEDYKDVISVKGGKDVFKEAFNFAFHCQKAEPPSLCAYKDLGILFVPKK